MKYSRRELQTQKRECVFQQLFLGEFYGADEKLPHLALFLDDSDLLTELELDRIEEMPGEERALLKARCEAVLEKLPELDAQIGEVSEGWKTSRMSRVDLSIIRLALYEMEYDDAHHVIHEAYFGTDMEPVLIEDGYAGYEQEYDPETGLMSIAPQPEGESNAR